MSTVMTQRPVNLGQLTTELAATGLTMTDDGDERTITCTDEAVTPEVLQAAVDSHVPVIVPTVTGLLQEQIDVLSDFVIGGGA